MFKFDIRGIYSNVVMHTVELTKDEGLTSLNLGKAVVQLVARGANLQGADLRGANLQGADLRHANLQGADLRHANLQDADLRHANLQDADLRHADLRHADLRGANLQDANLQDADLRHANLQHAYLQHADLRGADLPPHAIVPSEGAFIAWKKTTLGVIKIRIPTNAKRVSTLVGRKCRASEVKVLSGEGVGGKSLNRNSLVYTKGDLVKSDKFDDDIRVECTHGIHFFMTEQEAKEW